MAPTGRLSCCAHIHRNRSDLSERRFVIAGLGGQRHIACKLEIRIGSGLDIKKKSRGVETSGQGLSCRRIKLKKRGRVPQS